MEVKIKYNVLTYEGKTTTKTVTYDNCPDFESYKGKPLILEGKQLTEGFDYTVEYQVDKWVEEFDKWDWMEENDVQIIFSWEVVSAKKESKNLIVKEKNLTQSEMVGLWLKLSDTSEEYKANFIAVYSEMKSTIKDLKFEKQIDVTMKAMGVGIESAINVYKRLDDFDKALKHIKLDDYSSIKNGVVVYDKEKRDKDIEDFIKNNISLTE